MQEENLGVCQLRVELVSRGLGMWGEEEALHKGRLVKPFREDVPEPFLKNPYKRSPPHPAATIPSAQAQDSAQALDDTVELKAVVSLRLEYWRLSLDAM